MPGETCGTAKYDCPRSGGMRIPVAYQCDGQPDCPNGEDEQSCSKLTSSLPGMGTISGLSSTTLGPSPIRQPVVFSLEETDVELIRHLHDFLLLHRIKMSRA